MIRWTATGRIVRWPGLIVSATALWPRSPSLSLSLISWLRRWVLLLLSRVSSLRTISWELMHALANVTTVARVVKLVWVSRWNRPGLLLSLLHVQVRLLLGIAMRTVWHAKRYWKQLLLLHHISTIGHGVGIHKLLSLLQLKLFCPEIRYFWWSKLRLEPIGRVVIGQRYPASLFLHL